MGDGDAVNTIINGLSILESRAHDSAGVTTASDHGVLQIIKFTKRNQIRQNHIAYTFKKHDDPAPHLPRIWDL